MTHNAHCNGDTLASVAYSAKLLKPIDICSVSGLLVEVTTKVFVNLLSRFFCVFTA